MPRGRPKKQPSIAELQEMIRARRGERTKLLGERKKVQAKLDKIDRQIAAYDGDDGNGGGGYGSRPRNAKPLPDVIADVFKANSNKTMRIKDVAEAVEKAGYQSNSSNFRGIVNQTLIKEARFKQEGRGAYRLAKGG